MIDAILDPSVISDRHRLEIFFRLAEKHAKEVEIYIPSFFFRLKNMTEEEKRSVGRFFKLPGRRGIDFGFFQDVDLGKLRNVRSAPDFEMRYQKHSEFLENLRIEVPDPAVYEILAEEWVFMNEYSYIVASIKRGFEKFLRAGASYLIIGKKGMDLALSLAVNGPNKNPIGAPLNAFSIFRAVAKYVAAAGSSIGTTVIPNGVGIGVAIGSAIFLIMDP